MTACTHDLAERETDAADGGCSICNRARIVALEDALQTLDAHARKQSDWIRNSAILTYDTASDNPDRNSCRLCRRSWHVDRKERHEKGCLAAPYVAPQVKGARNGAA